METVRNKSKKVHFHLYLDADTAAWLRQEKLENYIPISATVALAVREYRKAREGTPSPHAGVQLQDSTLQGGDGVRAERESDRRNDE